MNDMHSLLVLRTLLEIVKQQQIAIKSLASGEPCTEAFQTASIETGKLAKLIDQLIDPEQLSSLKEELSKL